MHRFVLLFLLLLPLAALSQTADQPGSQYASYTLLLVPPNGEGYMVAIDKQQRIIFVPISSIKKAVDEGAAPKIIFSTIGSCCPTSN